MFITEAYAQTANAAPAGMEAALVSWLPILLIFGVFYFLILRPQMTRANEHAKMLEALKKGDKVLTNGGFYAEVVKLMDDGKVQLKLADSVEVEFAKTMIAQVVVEKEEPKKEAKKLKKKK